MEEIVSWCHKDERRVVLLSDLSSQQCLLSESVSLTQHGDRTAALNRTSIVLSSCLTASRVYQVEQGRLDGYKSEKSKGRKRGGDMFNTPDSCLSLSPFC